MKYTSYFALHIMLLGLIGCKGADVKTAREDFNDFYNRFLTDSSFQMQRVQFPLPGVRYGYGPDTTFVWTEQDWIMLKKPTLDGTEYNRRLQVSDTLATDEIFADNTGFYFKMVYEPIKRKWYLVYMVDSSL